MFHLNVSSFRVIQETLESHRAAKYLILLCNGHSL